jgi:hypothetical protein
MSYSIDPSTPNSGSPTIRDPEELTPYQLWVTEIEYAEKELKKFHERARKVARRYVDERDAVDSMNKWFNLFYANTHIMRAALYSQVPEPEIKRKYLDYNDQIGRVAANILQRATTPDCDDPRDTFDAAIRHAVIDRLVPGLGQVWLRLETETEDKELDDSILETQPEAGEGLPDAEQPSNSGFKTQNAPDDQPSKTTYKSITDQRVVVDYVYWEDFIWSPCRVWEERRWVGRRVFMSRAELRRRFGDKIGNAVPLTKGSRGTMSDSYPSPITPENQSLMRAKVYEIWDRDKREVVWLCREYPQLLDSKKDFLELTGFEPCPTPLFANNSTSNTVPRPDYYMVQDQYSELDTVNNRISLLIQACKVVGVYDRAAEGVQRMLLEGFDNTLIPVDNWAMFAEKGGVKGQVDWLPLEQVTNCLQRLNESREIIKGQIYEITGIADIVRGASKASETLGAQEIKAKFASIRIKDIQDDVARFVAEVLRIKAEILVKHYDPEILIRKSNILRTDDAQMADPAVQLLQSEEGFEWRIVVTSDQLAQADYDMEKKDAIELVTAISGYFQQIAPIIQAKPEATPLFATVLKWAVSKFKGARDIEGMIDRALDDMIKNPPQSTPDPEVQKAEMEQKRMEMEMQMKRQDAQLKQVSNVQELRFKQQEHQMEMQQMTQKAQVDGAVQMQKARTGMMADQLKLLSQHQQGQMDLQQRAAQHSQALRQSKEKAKATSELANRMTGGKNAA